MSRRPGRDQSTAGFNLSPLEDQQLAGLIVWVVAGLVYLAAIAWLFVKWFWEAERRVRAPGFDQIMPLAVVAALALMPGGCEKTSRAQANDDGGDPARGSVLIQREGCGGCHVIPGIASAQGVVGPSLSMVGRRVFIAGLLPNSPETMVLWLQHPQSVVPGNAMPDMNISENDARDIAAFLATLQ